MQGSKVILRGTVRSSAEKQAAEEAAWSALGVSEVDNRIVVSLTRSGTMVQPDCEPIIQTIQSLAQQIEEIDSRIGALEAEVMQLNPLQYVVSQRGVDRLVRVKHTLQDRWNNAMSELAICRSAHPEPALR